MQAQHAVQWRMRNVYLQMARITDPIMHAAVVCVRANLLLDLWRVPQSAVRLHMRAISSIYLKTALANLYVRISSAKLTSRTLLAP